MLKANIRRTVSGYALHELFITHQLPKGLEVDETVILGKDIVGNAAPRSGEAGL